ncbi:cysteine proteinase [Gigaspora margarita]|uniref:Cysteine proteinase n=1 Tax=Gigaspora margarita TaxID=4874 RepID=A0A8H3X056_GIGMA|nr:cysteine proteinase [Gigaspora margarita]
MPPRKGKSAAKNDSAASGAVRSIETPENPRIKRPRREDATEAATISESPTHKQTSAHNEKERAVGEQQTDDSGFMEISTVSDQVQPIENISMEDASSGEKSNMDSSLHIVQESSNSVRSEPNDDTDPIIQKRWEIIKERLFEIPKLSKPPYKDYQEKIVVRRPWMKKKDIDYLQKLLTDPNSPLGHKYIKHIINHNVYSDFSDEQKTRLMNLLPRSDLVPIASDAGEPIDTPRIERERQAQGLKLYEAGISGTVTEIDPHKVVPRFDFWLSDAFKDSRWWFQLSVKFGYFTKLGVDSQWTNLEKFKTEVPDVWKNDAYEQDWGIGIWGRMGNKQIAGDSAQITLTDMVKALIIRADDTLKYKRQFKNLGITVTMDLKVIAVDKTNGNLTINFQKGKLNKTINDIVNPTRLEHELLDFDGRVPKKSRPNGNAFKNFSIVRSPEYTPSLFELRKEYWAKNQ